LWKIFKIINKVVVGYAYGKQLTIIKLLHST